MSSIMTGVQENPARTKMQLDELLEKYKELPDSSKGLVYSNIAVTYGIRSMTDSGIAALNIAIPLLSGNKKTLALKNMGNFYRIKGDYPKSIQFYQSAIEQNKSGSKFVRSKIIGELATAYYEMSNFEKSIQYCREAIQLDREMGKEGKAHEMMMKGKMANNFIANGSYDFAEKELESLIEEQQNLPDQSTYNNSRMLLGFVYTNTGKYYKAKELLNEVLSYYKQINNEELYDYTLATLADNERKGGNPALGLNYIKAVFNNAITKKHTRIPEYACIYLELLNKQQLFDEGVKIISLLKGNELMQKARLEVKIRYKTAVIPFLKQSNNLAALINEQDSVIKLSEQKLKSEKDKIVSEMQAKYQTEVTEKNNNILTQEKELLSKSERIKTWLLLLIVSVSLIILLLFSIIFYRKNIESRLQQQEMEKQKQQNEYLESKAVLEKEQRKLKEQIIEQQKTELLYHVNESNQLKEKLTTLLKNNNMKSNDEISFQLDQLKEDKKHWEHFMARFNATFPDFTKKLSDHYPELTNADLQFCSLLRLNLNNKEIAHVLNIEPISIYKKRSRLIDKMKLQEGDALENVLMEI